MLKYDQITEGIGMMTIDTRQVQQLSNRLNGLQVKFAERNTVNDLAFETQKLSRENIRNDFTTRNKWTERSVQVDRATSLGMSSEVGSVESYMADQEFGAEHTDGTAIARPAASGESNRARTRRKVVRKANRMTSIRLKRKVQWQGSRAATNAAALKKAKADGERFVFLDRGPRNRGIYRVMGTKNKPKARMVQDLSRKTHVVPRNPWLRPATERAVTRGQEFFARRLAQQLRRVS